MGECFQSLAEKTHQKISLQAPEAGELAEMFKLHIAMDAVISVGAPIWSDTLQYLFCVRLSLYLMCFSIAFLCGEHSKAAMIVDCAKGLLLYRFAFFMRINRHVLPPLLCHAFGWLSP